jgi:nicotinamide-nucleotide amidase
MLTPEIITLAQRVGSLLRERNDTVAVAEGSAGGLISATLLSIPGASAYYVGGTVIYTLAASRAWMAGEVDVPAGMRGASEDFATWLAASVRRKVGATWGLGEAGAAGPANPYGDPAGHTWLAVDGPSSATRNLLTGVDERAANMVAFAEASLQLFSEVLAAA